MLSIKDKIYIYNKIIQNHPGYILDENFNINNIEEFMSNNKGPHFTINYNKQILNMKNNISLEFKYYIDNNNAYIKIPTFQLVASNDLLKFCNNIKHNKQITNLIIDIRNNRGGNSDYADILIKKLYGIDMYNYVKYKWNKHIKILWRNSNDVINKLINYNNKYYN